MALSIIYWKLKIGRGLEFYSQLEYIGSLSNQMSFPFGKFQTHLGGWWSTGPMKNRH